MGEWKIIPKFTNYSCSKLGKIKNNKTDKILNPFENLGGYVRMSVRNNNKNKSIYLHRLVAQTWIPNPENKPTINHKNKIRNDNRVENLEWATHKEQAEHKIKFNKENNIIEKHNSNRGIWKCNPDTNQKIQYYKTLDEAISDLNLQKNSFRQLSFAVLHNKKIFNFKWIYDDHYYENEINEEWKLYIKTKQSIYYISNYGKVRNKERLLKCGGDSEGYRLTRINNNNKRVHIMVAEKFIDNPNNYNIVNHKDGNKQNNIHTNLEWVTPQINSQHAIETGLRKNVKKIIQYDDNNNIIEIFNTSVWASKKLNVTIQSIHRYCKGEITLPQFKLKYLSDSDDLVNKKIDINTINKNKVKEIKRIIQYDENYNIIKIFNSIKEASDQLNMGITTIRNYCKAINTNIGQIKLKYLVTTDDLINNKVDINTIKTNNKIDQRNSKIIQYDINYKMIEVYDSMLECCNILNICLSSAKNCCSGKWDSCKNETIRLKRLCDFDDFKNKNIIL